MVSLAHKFAYENALVSVEAISVLALPEAAKGYRVLGTPHAVINGEHHLKGRINEKQLLKAIQLICVEN